MKKNMGTLDRFIRVVLALIVVVLYLAGQISGTAALVLGLLAVVFIVTGLVGSCPLYGAIGFSTNRPKPAAP